jgi:hypothetical protein
MKLLPTIKFNDAQKMILIKRILKSNIGKVTIIVRCIVLKTLRYSYWVAMKMKLN